MTRGTEKGRREASAAPHGPADGSESEFFTEVGARLAEFGASVREYLGIRVDRIRLTIAERMFRLALVLGVATFAIAFIATTVVFGFVGVAGLMTAATGNHWLGALIASMLGLGALAVAALIARNRLRRRKGRREDGGADD